MRRGVQGRLDVPVWMVAAGAVLMIILLFLLYVLFTMGAAPAVGEVVADVPVRF
jgi:type VI protein secretion system component VasF